MLWNGELARLAALEADLIAVSELQRRGVMIHCARLQPVASRVEAGVRLARSIPPLIFAGVPLLALWAGRKGTRGVWSKVRAGLQTWASVSEVWRSFR